MAVATIHKRTTPLLSCHEPGTTGTQAECDFPLTVLRCGLLAAERGEAAVASGAGRILCFLIEATIYPA